MRNRHVDSAPGSVHRPVSRTVSSQIAGAGLEVDMWTVGRYIISHASCPHLGGSRQLLGNGAISEVVLALSIIGGSPFHVHCLRSLTVPE